MNQLIDYLRNNLILDFQGDLDLEMCREFLKDDDSREARQLLAKLVQDKGTDEMFTILSDCLVEAVRNALSDASIREELRTYAES